MINRILFDCERLKYPNTGLYTFCESLGNALLANADKETQITMYVPETADEIFGKQTDYFIQKSWHKLFVPRTSKFNIWHISNQVSKYIPSNKKTKLVLTIHDLNFLVEKRLNPIKVAKLLCRVQKRIDRATSIICISNFVANQVREHLKIGNTKLSVIYNGCTIQDYPDFNTPSYRPSKSFLFSIGTLLPKKNFHVLPALLKDNDLELVIAGNLTSKAYIDLIMVEAEKYKVTDRVKIIGSITDQDRCWYYKNCNAFVFPSIAEGFGLPVIEAMHYGAPVFLSTHTSLPEVGGDAAYYFESFDPTEMQQTFKKGMKDFAETNMAQKARDRAKQFSWSETANAYMKIYKEIL